MADIFISYSHDDQPFVRSMVQALEAEGFSVWWDHTIPPGKTWDTFIAKAIADAGCCIILWSQHSIVSDWVKEEATLAKDAGKLLPVTIGGVEPPMGFRRLQAANLTNWQGDRNNPQWQLLVREARNHHPASGQRAAPIHRPTPTPPPSRPNASPVALGGLALAIILSVGAGWFFLRSGPPPTEVAESVDPPDASIAAETTTPVMTTDSVELERLREERDAALERERNQRAENDRLSRERSVPPPVVTVGRDWVMGDWIEVGESACHTYQRFQMSDGEMTWHATQDGTFGPGSPVAFDAEREIWSSGSNNSFATLTRSNDQLRATFNDGNICYFRRR